MNVFHQIHSEPQILHNQTIRFVPHLHEELELIVLFSGGAVLTVDGRDTTLYAGDFALIFPDEVHSYESAEPVDVGKFIFSAQIVPELAAAMAAVAPRSPRIPADAAQRVGLTTLARRILSEYEQSTAMVQRAQLFLLAALALSVCPMEPAAAASDDTLHRLFTYCRMHYRDDLSLETVSQVLFVSKSTLSHIFSERVGMNFREYINALRVNEAMQLLQQTTHSVTYIASECGFRSIRSFNRAFVRHIGTSPRAYRKNDVSYDG